MKKSKFRCILTVFLVIIGVLAVLFGCLSPLILHRDERLSASASTTNPTSITLYWNNTMIRNATMTDSEDNFITFTNGVSQSPELTNGGVYVVSFSSYSSNIVVIDVICDNSVITAGVHNPNDNSFTFTYQAGGPALRFGIITNNSVYDSYQKVSLTVDNSQDSILYLTTEDDLMPRMLYPGSSYILYLKGITSTSPRTLLFVVYPDSDAVFTNVSLSGDGLLLDINLSAASFNVRWSFKGGASNSYTTSLSLFSLDISSELENAYNQGYNAGHQSGYNSGYEAGYALGYNDGSQVGSDQGSFDKGYNTGYNDGYSVGLAAGQNISWGNLNVVSLFLSPVNSFLATPLFGSFSIGTAFSVVLVVLLAAIFIKMFAGG